MAQKQFTNYQDDILSFDLREAMLGILKPGRYCGFDTATHVSTGSGVINITISHAGSGVQKASKANPPVLGSRTGVAVTPQGLIIHEDGTSIAIAIDDGSGNGGNTRYDVIYMSHYYLDGIPGSNPATYGIRKGTPGAGTPSLASPNLQVGLILVTIPNGATTFGALTFTPIQYELGDLSITANLLSIIGARTYTEQNYITNGQSVTASLDALDMILKDRTDTLAAIPNTKLDDWATPDDNTDLNASSSRHGLLPKLSNVLTDFLNGQGGWTKPLGKRLVSPSSVSGFSIADFGGTASAWNTLDLSAYLPADVDTVFIRFTSWKKVSYSAPHTVQLQANDATGPNVLCCNHHNNGFPVTFTMVLRTDSSRRIRWTTNDTVAMATIYDAVQLTIDGYISAL